MRVFLHAVLMSMTVSCGFEIVDTGHRGIETRFGEVVGKSLPEGLHFYNPFTSNITELDVRVNRSELDLQTYTKDVQQAVIRVVTTYSLNKDAAHLVFQEYGIDYAVKILPQAVEGAAKAVIGNWDAVDLISNREKARALIELNLAASVKDKHILISKFEITDIAYNETFEVAVEKKVTAIQYAIEAKNKTVQIQEEANQQVIKAKAQAESMTIRAQALSSNKNLIEYEAVQKWNGVLPTMMLSNGATPFINLGKQ